MSQPLIGRGATVENIKDLAGKKVVSIPYRRGRNLNPLTLIPRTCCVSIPYRRGRNELNILSIDFDFFVSIPYRKGRNFHSQNIVKA